jgi:hypothetical protein
VDRAATPILSEVDLEEPSDFVLADPEKEERFEGLNLTTSSRVYLCLLIEMRHACDLFVDFSIRKHSLTVWQTPYVLQLVTRILIFFPSEYRQSNVILR